MFRSVGVLNLPESSGLPVTAACPGSAAKRAVEAVVSEQIITELKPSFSVAMETIASEFTAWGGFRISAFAKENLVSRELRV